MKKLCYLIMGMMIWDCFADQQQESFIVKKKKPHQSVNKLKEQYGDELANIIRVIPQLQKQLADLQEHLIDELSSLLENDLNICKIDLDTRLKKAADLRSYLSQDSTIINDKMTFVKHITCKY